MSDLTIEQVTEWGALGCLAAHEERKRLDNSGDDHSQLAPRYRIVRSARKAVQP